MDQGLLTLGKEVVIANILRSNAACDKEGKIPVTRIAAWGSVPVWEVEQLQTMMDELCLRNIIRETEERKTLPDGVVDTLEKLFPQYLRYYAEQISTTEWEQIAIACGLCENEVSEMLWNSTKLFVDRLGQYIGHSYMGRYPLDVLKEICGLSVPVDMDQWIELCRCNRRKEA